MSKNQDTLKDKIYNYLKGLGYEPEMLSSSGKEVPVVEEADIFRFTFQKDGKSYGTAYVSIDNSNVLTVYQSDELQNSPDEMSNDPSWEQVRLQLRKMSFPLGIKSFDVRNKNHLENDMAKREYNKKLDEGYYPMGKKASYSDNIPETKMIIQHTRNIEEGEQRYRNVARIFIENMNGERFLLPTTKPGIGRVYARHIAEGGTPYDERGQHITSLVEEYSKMAGFVRATRNGQFNESAQRLVTEGINHYQSLRETLHKLTGKKGYSNYFESYTPSLMEDEEQKDLSEMFMSASLDPRIECVMPILSKLSKNITEDNMKEIQSLEEWADNVIEGRDDDDDGLIAGRYTPEQWAKMVNGVKKLAHKQTVVKTNNPIGSRVSDIGPGGKEHNVTTDKEWDKQQGMSKGLNEFAPAGSGDGGDGFSEETLKKLAAQWFNGDEDPEVERTLAAAGWEIGQDEGYDDEPGVFVVQSGDINGDSYLSWPADELSQGVAEGVYQGQFKTKEQAIAYAKTVKHRDPDDGIEIWEMPGNTFDVVHTMNANGRNHCIQNGGKKLGTIGPRFKGVAEGTLNEYRDALYTFVKSKFPTWPEYVLKDFLYAQAKGIRNQEELKDFLDRNQKDFGEVKWRLEKLPITLDIFTPKTQRMIKQREGGSSNPMQVPRDAERHAQQLKMIQQQGVRTEPIIVAKLDNGYDLIEGWHRTIQHLQQYPEGYTGPAWVAYGATYTSESKQGMSEDLDINQKRAGQLGPTEKVKNNNIGKLVGAMESTDPLARILKLAK